MTDPHRTAADAISQVRREILAGKHGKVTLDQRHMLYAAAVFRSANLQFVPVEAPVNGEETHRLPSLAEIDEARQRLYYPDAVPQGALKPSQEGQS